MVIVTLAGTGCAATSAARPGRAAHAEPAWELCFVARQAAPLMSGSAPPQWVAAATPAVRPQGSARSSPVVREDLAPQPLPPVAPVADPSIVARYPAREGSMKERSPIWPQWSKRQCASAVAVIELNQLPRRASLRRGVLVIYDSKVRCSLCAHKSRAPTATLYHAGCGRIGLLTRRCRDRATSKRP